MNTSLLGQYLITISFFFGEEEKNFLNKIKIYENNAPNF